MNEFTPVKNSIHQKSLCVDFIEYSMYDIFMYEV